MTTLAQTFHCDIRLDTEWMWRVYITDDRGCLIGVSPDAYFLRNEAERALISIAGQ